MGTMGKNTRTLLDDLQIMQNINCTVSDKRDENGRYVITCDEDEDVFFEKLGYIKLEDAMKRFNDIQERNL